MIWQDDTGRPRIGPCDAARPAYAGALHKHGALIEEEDLDATDDGIAVKPDEWWSRHAAAGWLTSPAALVPSGKIMRRCCARRWTRRARRQLGAGQDSPQ
jgi:hypothetical protein